MVEGDPGMESLYKRNADGTLHVATVGAFGGGEGGHWLTGPVFVCGAQPGDVLQVSIKPRLHQRISQSMGQHACTRYGSQAGHLHITHLSLVAA